MAAKTVPLNYVDAIHVATVLEDCVDQLVILGRVMPGTFVEAENIVEEEMVHLVESQKQAESSFIISQSVTRADGDSVHVALKRSAQQFARAIKQSPLAANNVEKMQSDRSFLETVLHTTMLELIDRATFVTLTDAVKQEKDHKAKFEDAIKKESDGRKMTKFLQKKLIETKKEREREIMKRVEMIAHLKDQLQEMKAKTCMESKYVRKVTDVNALQMLKKCTLAEAKLEKEMNDIKTKIDEENRVNAEIESFLRTHIDKRQELLHYWVDKYDNDVEAKQKELDLLKAAKLKDYERLMELTRLYREYEQVVVDDRVEKEKIRRRLEKDEEEVIAATKCQAWWRGMMVRRCLGQYKPKKKKKGKGGKGKEKGKGKK